MTHLLQVRLSAITASLAKVDAQISPMSEALAMYSMMLDICEAGEVSSLAASRARIKADLEDLLKERESLVRQQTETLLLTEAA